jgi:hypothetical protein
MAKQRLFPEPQKTSDDDKTGTREQFEHVASRVFSVPKSEIDKREKQWKNRRRKTSN